jgi:hypothetical protein
MQISKLNALLDDLLDMGRYLNTIHRTEVTDKATPRQKTKIAHAIALLELALADLEAQTDPRMRPAKQAPRYRGKDTRPRKKRVFTQREAAGRAAKRTKKQPARTMNMVEYGHHVAENYKQRA